MLTRIHDYGKWEYGNKIGHPVNKVRCKVGEKKIKLINTYLYPMNQPTIQLSAVIITYNEEACIERCIRSVQAVADEIIVLDSFSTDRTEEICRSLGVRFEQHAFNGMIEQRNRSWNMASGKYVLSMDADEVLSPELTSSILTEKANGFQRDYYSMNRMSCIGDKWIRHGSWYPDKKLRLARKEAAYFGGINPHDKLILRNSSTPIHLKGDILHYAFTDFEEYRKQSEKYSSISAQALMIAGKRATILKCYLNSSVAFIKSYFLKRGILDGVIGWRIAVEIARQTKMKYMKLRKLRGS